MSDNQLQSETSKSDNLILLEEYKFKWDYYKETLVNRKNLFDWYFKIVTIPASAFGVANILSEAKKETSFSVEHYKYIFLLIFLCGFGLFISYAIETGISQMYINRIKSIEVVLMKLNHKKSKFNIFKSVGFWRVIPIILINSFLLTLSISLLKKCNPIALLFVFLLSIILHFSLYKPLHKLGEKKNNIVVSEGD